jgi:oligoribonuclease (3'-5' exoribonuclease)
MADNGAANERLIWIDLEMTGLDTDNDSIIEIATVVTDAQLNVLAEGPEFAIHHRWKRWKRWTSGTATSTAARACGSAWWTAPPPWARPRRRR